MISRDRVECLKRVQTFLKGKDFLISPSSLVDQTGLTERWPEGRFLVKNVFGKWIVYKATSKENANAFKVCDWTIYLWLNLLEVDEELSDLLLSCLPRDPGTFTSFSDRSDLRKNFWNEHCDHLRVVADALQSSEPELGKLLLLWLDVVPKEGYEKAFEQAFVEESEWEASCRRFRMTESEG